MPPYCEEHQMYHDNPHQCHSMRAATLRLAREARLRERAERIALAAVREYGYSDYPKTHDSESGAAYAVALAAALAALWSA